MKLTVLLVLIVITLLGNSALIAVSMCHGKLRQKRVDVFLANLAAGDLMVCVVTMTTEILFIAFGGYWVLGPVACKLTVYGQIVTLASSTFLLTAMAMDRYQVCSSL
jgi:neuropeptide S receptor 1